MIFARGAPIPEFTVAVKCIHKYLQIPTHGNTIGHADIMSLLL